MGYFPPFTDSSEYSGSRNGNGSVIKDMQADFSLQMSPILERFFSNDTFIYMMKCKNISHICLKTNENCLAQGCW